MEEARRSKKKKKEEGGGEVGVALVPDEKRLPQVDSEDSFQLFF
jgi:hypothetical protein